MKKRHFCGKKMILVLNLTALLLLSGCTVGGKEILLETEMPSDTLFVMEDLTCRPEELKLFLANYKSIYGGIYDTDFWTSCSNKEEMALTVKEAAFAHLTRVYALGLYAIAHDISLTDSEVESCNEAANEYFDTLNPVEISFTGATVNIVSKLYQTYALAEKAYSSIMETVNTEVSDDEARVMDAMLIFTTDKARADEAYTKAAESSDFGSIAATYSQLSYIELSFGRGDYPEDIENIVFLLDDGAYSEVLETDGGYMIFYCVNKYNEELSEQKKLDIIERRREKALNSIYSFYKSNATSVLNEKLYDSIEMDDSPDIVTNSLFEVLDSYISF